MTRARDIASSGGLILLNQTTVTAAATVDINNVFSSTYQNYKLMFHSTGTSSNQDVRVRLLASGTATTTGYRDGQVGLTSNGGAYNVSGNNTSSIYLMSIASGDPSQSAVSCDIYKPFLTLGTTFIITSASNDGIQFAGRSGGGSQENAISFDGLRIFGGANITGVIRIYGYRN